MRKTSTDEVFDEHTQGGIVPVIYRDSIYGKWCGTCSNSIEMGMVVEGGEFRKVLSGTGCSKDREGKVQNY